ncbi:MAG: Gfo/Idh/MocA family oxidoreductase [Chloroflexota bacterium]
MTNTIKVGMVGLGLAFTPHLKGYLSHPQAEVIAVCDLNEERAKSVATEFQIPHVYTDYETMLREADINTVDITTPTFLHASMTTKAAAAGKHIHCEKPFCRSVAEGLEACDTAKSNQVKILVGETYCFIASHMKARALIEAGEIGRPLQIRQRHGDWLARPKPRIYTGPKDRQWRVNPEQSGGGNYPWIFDHAVHFFATAEYLMLDQKIAEVYAISASAGQNRQQGAEHDPYQTAEADTPIITWKYEDTACQGLWVRGERLNGKYDFMRGFSTIVVGETGMIEVLGEGGHNLLWEGEQKHLILHRAVKETQTFRFDEGGDDVWQSDIAYYSQGHINQVHHFVDAILNDTDVRYTGEDGVRAVQCTLAAIQSAQTGLPVVVETVEAEFTAY